MGSQLDTLLQKQIQAQILDVQRKNPCHLGIEESGQPCGDVNACWLKCANLRKLGSLANGLVGIEPFTLPARPMVALAQQAPNSRRADTVEYASDPTTLNLNASARNWV